VHIVTVLHAYIHFKANSSLWKCVLILQQASWQLQRYEITVYVQFLCKNLRNINKQGVTTVKSIKCRTSLIQPFLDTVPNDTLN